MYFLQLGETEKVSNHIQQFSLEILSSDISHTFQQCTLFCDEARPESSQFLQFS